MIQKKYHPLLSGESDFFLILFLDASKKRSTYKFKYLHLHFDTKTGLEKENINGFAFAIHITDQYRI